MTIHKSKRSSASREIPVGESLWLSTDEQSPADFSYERSLTRLNRTDRPYGLLSTFEFPARSPKKSKAVQVVDSFHGQVYVIDRDTVEVFFATTAEKSLGETVEGVSAPLAIYNTFAEDLTISKIEIFQEGVLEIEGLSEGDQILAFQQLDFLVVYTPVFSKLVYCLIEFTFSNSSKTQFIVTGERVIYTLPKFEQPFEEYIQHFTEVITASTGRTQRRDLRKYPRKHLAIQVKTFDNHTARSISNTYTGSPATPIGVPLWHMQDQLPGEYPKDTLVLPVDTTEVEYHVGGDIIIWQSDDYFDVYAIGAVENNQITLAQGLIRPFNDPIIAPYRSMRHVTAPRWTEHNGFTVFDMEFMDDSPFPIDPWVASSTYKSQPVFPYGVNLFKTDSRSREFENSFYSYDAGTGLKQKDPMFDNSKLTLPFGIECNSRSECWELRRIVHYLRGRQKVVWLDSMTHDFMPVGSVIAAGDTIEVYANNYLDVHKDGSPYRNICIRNADGSAAWREITDVEDMGETYVLTLDSAIVEQQVSDIRISTVALGRLNHDSVSFEWTGVDELSCLFEFVMEVE